MQVLFIIVEHLICWLHLSQLWLIEFGKREFQNQNKGKWYSINEDTVNKAKDKRYTSLEMAHLSVNMEPINEYEAVKSLNKSVKEFEYCVWAAGMQNAVNRQTVRGLKGKVDDSLEIITYTIAARTIITLQETNGNNVSFCSGEKEKPSRMGLQSFNCTVNEAIELIKRCIKSWDTNGIRLIDDKDIGII